MTNLLTFGGFYNAICDLGKYISQKFAFYNVYTVECISADGTLRWKEEVKNLVTNVGLNDVLDKYFKGSAYTALHYVGLTNGSPTFAAADTMASHGGWTEVQDYSQATRQTLTLGTVASQSVSNTASKASFSINADVTIGGAFITTNNTKGGTSGTLFGGAAFTNGNRAAQNGDTINVTTTLSAASV